MARISRLAKPLFWGSAGAAVAYLSDPDRGRSRRAALKDQATARLRQSRQELDRRATYVRSTAQGKVEHLRRSEGTAPADDRALVDKVKSEVLGGAQFQGHQVLVEAADGVVTLRGEVADSSVIDALDKAVANVAGVREVCNLVHLPGEPAPNKREALNASATPGSA